MPRRRYSILIEAGGGHVSITYQNIGGGNFVVAQYQWGANYSQVYFKAGNYLQVISES